MDISRNRLSKAIRQARKMRGLTQEQLAEKLGVTSKHIDQIEHGRRGASTKLLFEIADELSISIDALSDKHDDQEALALQIYCTLKSCSYTELVLLNELMQTLLRSMRNLHEKQG